MYEFPKNLMKILDYYILFLNLSMCIYLCECIYVYCPQRPKRASDSLQLELHINSGSHNRTATGFNCLSHLSSSYFVLKTVSSLKIKYYSFVRMIIIFAFLKVIHPFSNIK